MKDLWNHNILVVESSNTDMVVKISHLPRPGETILGGTFFMSPGGKGVNQVIAIVRLGGQVSFIYKAGSDIFGYQSQQLSEGEGIDTSYIFSDPKNPSGIALITVDAHAENYIVVASGANANLLPSGLAKSEEAVEKAGLTLMQLGIPMDTVEFVAKIASKKSKRVMLNPVPAQTLSAMLLRHLYTITPNEIEAKMISGMKITDEVSAKKAAQVIIEMRVQNAIVTLDSKGILIYCDSMIDVVPTMEVEVVNTTATGDIFNGTLTVTLAEGWDLGGTVRFACKVPATSMTCVGAQSSVPYRNEVDIFD